MRHVVLLFTFILCVATLGIPVFSNSTQEPAGPPIRLKAGTFEPSLGEPVLPAELRATENQAGPGVYIVQFEGPVKAAWKGALTATGAEVLDYIPDHAFKVRMSPDQAEAIRALRPVRWVGLFHPAYKLSPHLERGIESLYKVRLEHGADAARAVELIRTLGARVGSAAGNTLVAAVPAARLAALAGLAEVAWVENYSLPVKHNEYAGPIIGTTATSAAGYDGSTQTVGVADSGLGGGTAATAHVHIPSGRISAIYNWPGLLENNSCAGTIVDDGAIDVMRAHGTHVSGSILGEGNASGQGRGVAPAATLLFQAVENWMVWLEDGDFCSSLADDYYMIGIPNDVRALFQQAYDAGARVHSNTWGSTSNWGSYTTDAANADDFVWDHPDLTVVFSTGNNGSDWNPGDALLDETTLAPQATAKNVLSVGSSENERGSAADPHYECDTSFSDPECPAEGQNMIVGWSVTNGGRFYTEPLASDPIAGNAEQMAGLSGTGPTLDGRIKPDVVAPGTFILAAYSDLYQFGYDPSPNPQNGAYQLNGTRAPLNQEYKYMTGTTHAAALGAGAATVVRDYYQKDHGHSASAALVKATIINSAVDLLDENNDGVDDNDYPIPNHMEGWGRIDLAAATDGSRLFEVEDIGAATDDVFSYSYDVTAGTPLKVTLVWSDYPAAPQTGADLVNNLDLEVSGPSGVPFHLGNDFASGWSTTGGTVDTLNNVENVFVQSPAAGTWMVTVRGYSVPNGPQPFALVVAGDVAREGTVTHTLFVTAPTHGNVTGSGINCGTLGSVCSATYTAGDPVSLTAASTVTGYELTGWTGDCSGLTCSLTMNVDHSVGTAFNVLPVDASIDDPVSITEGDCGTSNLTFTVTLASASLEPVTVTYQTQDGTATQAEDYTLTSGMLTFAPGVVSLPIDVPIVGETAFEVDETFTVELTLATNAAIVDGVGQGTILNDDIDPATGLEPVTWVNLVGVSTCGPTQTKTAVEAWGNAGASSTRQIDADGYAEFTVSADPGYAMFGLASDDADRTYADIDFTFYTYPGTGALMIFESGAYVTSVGTYAEGQKLKISLASGTVTYSIDDSVVYTSGQTPASTLRVDTSLYFPGANVYATLGGTVTDVPVPPTEPVAWANLAGVSTSSNRVTKTAITGWNAGASSTRQVDGDGYAEFTLPASSGYVMFGLSSDDEDRGFADIDFAFYTYPATGQLMVFEGGAYAATLGAYAYGQVLRISLDGGLITYWIDGTLAYTSAQTPAATLRVDTTLYSQGASITATLGGTLIDVPMPPTEPVAWTNLMGVSAAGDTVSKTAPDGWGNAGASSTRQVDADGYVEFTIPADPGYAMFGLASDDVDWTTADIDFAFYTYPPTGRIMISEGGSLVASIGTYTTGLRLRISLESGVITYWRDGMLAYTSGQTPAAALRVDTSLYSSLASVRATLGGTVSDVPAIPTEAVAWANLVGVSDTGNSLSKTGSAGWNAGASSTRQVDGAGYVEFTVPADPGYAMFGLASDDADQTYADIDFAFYTYPPTGQVMISEGGSLITSLGAYAQGQVLKVSLAAGTVTYWIDGVLRYTSGQTPAAALRVDTSLYSTGAAVENATLGGTLIDVP